MPTIRLTKRVVDGLRPAEKTIIYYDAELKGFGVRITPAGARSWIVEYRPGGGRSSPTKRMTIGPLGTLTPDEARRKARDVLANARLGGDPAAEQLRQRGALTLAQAAHHFLSDEAGRLKPGTLRNYELYFRRHILPQLGSTKIGNVTPADVARLHRSLGRTMPVTANRAVEAIGSLYRYAAREGLVDRGFRPPSTDVIAFREKACERFLSMEELSRLGVALEQAETEGIPWSINQKGCARRRSSSSRP